MLHTRKFSALLLLTLLSILVLTGCEHKTAESDSVDTNTDTVEDSGIDSSIQRHDRSELEEQGIEVRGLYEKALEDGVVFPYNESETL